MSNDFKWRDKLVTGAQSISLDQSELGWPTLQRGIIATSQHSSTHSDEQQTVIGQLCRITLSTAASLYFQRQAVKSAMTLRNPLTCSGYLG